MGTSVLGPPGVLVDLRESGSTFWGRRGPLRKLGGLGEAVGTAGALSVLDVRRLACRRVVYGRLVSSWPVSGLAGVRVRRSARSWALGEGVGHVGVGSTWPVVGPGEVGASGATYHVREP
jgi:hypothetical protein